MYDTPTHLVRQLARHLPKCPHRLLDPAAGNGALLWPLVKRFERNHTQVVCVDTDAELLSDLLNKFRNYAFRADYVNDDFLDWGMEQRPGTFDCVLMNPPFAASQSDCRTVNLPDRPMEWDMPESPMPVEAAFVCVAHRLLANKGRLLAVLPCSVIMSESLQWLRSRLLSTGSIEYVYEFPPHTFKTVESKIFLFVFEKGSRRRRIELIKPKKAARSLRLTLKPIQDVPSRLDFDFHRSRSRMQQLMFKKNLHWTRLGDIAQIFRGTVPSAPRPKGVVHSTDFQQGRWQRPIEESKIELTRGRICVHDLLIRRVGRNCLRTLGDARSVVGFFATDCLFVIRPYDDIPTPKLLFAIKMLASVDWLASLLERGTGARYFCKSSLEQLQIPMAACQVYADCFNNFLKEKAGDHEDGRSPSITRARTYLLDTSSDNPPSCYFSSPRIRTCEEIHSPESLQRSIGSTTKHNGSSL